MVHIKFTLLPRITSHKKLYPQHSCLHQLSLWSLCFACQAGTTLCSQKRLEDVEQDWGITFHQEDSFIVGCLGLEIGTNYSSKDRLQRRRKQGEKKFERSSNLPHLKRAIFGKFVWPVLKTLQRRSARDLSLSGGEGVRPTIPGMWKQASPAPFSRQPASSPVAVRSSHPCFHMLGSTLWKYGKVGCYISERRLLWSGYSKEFPFRANPFTHRRFFSGSQDCRCWAWSILHHVGGFRPILSFLIISMSISIHQIRDF